MSLAARLADLAARPGGGRACLRVLQTELMRASGLAGKAVYRVQSARRERAIAEDESRSPSERRDAAVRGLLDLSCARFWASPASLCHELSSEYDARIVAAVERDIS